MGWPKDPIKRAEALARQQAAQKARWARPEERAAARKRGLSQWTPEKRAEMSAVKRGQYVEDPTLRKRVVSPNAAAHAAHARAARRDQLKYGREPAARLALIRERAKRG